ncbi:ADP-dependent glucokinase/phosphofructokinase [Micromonospora radicis]|uniref:ADP-dependent glucokinase/phosphofructokinase n=1 Tax=Micromonospora radicis TaxID=1894971 RepID=UPI001313FDC6|nr:ADP-dependent glucokinase/phosphofructokinase [Micromonospora radicis]
MLETFADYFSSGVEDTHYPHLIVQYDQGLRIRAGDLDVTAPFPNRLIYVNDPDNSDLRLSGDLGDRLGTADVLLISGFNAMRSATQLDHRLTELRAYLRRLPTGAVTYFEDAAYHEPAFSRQVRDTLLDAIDVYGLNEDELQSYLGHPPLRERPPGVAARKDRSLRYATLPVRPGARPLAS